LDVFTRERLKGNPLAVVMQADALLDNQMQAIASEFNLSETVFVNRPQAERHTAGVRIFTPRIELPFAGHPTVGAAVALGLQSRASAIRLEEKIGVITCVIERIDKHIGQARFALPKLPEEVGKAPPPLAIAGTLGLDPDDIGCEELKPALYSAGVPYYLIPVRDTAVLKRISLQRRGWDEIYPFGQGSVYVFTRTPDEAGFDFAARMFSPGMGLGEDPATGSAAAALIGLLSKDAHPGQTEFTLRQGHEMGRPSSIQLQFRIDDGKLTHGGIGGDAVIIGQGVLELDDEVVGARRREP
jgi:trans-2,3-dihydro-3-hydroxyanthranilate isomerase